MTKKQFNWLKNHQPFEVRYVKLYDGAYVGGCHIRKVIFNGEYIIVKGVSHTYNRETKTFKEKAVYDKVHYRNIQKLVYQKGIYYEQYYNTYNTEGNTKK